MLNGSVIPWPVWCLISSCCSVAPLCIAGNYVLHLPCQLLLARYNQWEALVEYWGGWKREKPKYFALSFSAGGGLIAATYLSLLIPLLQGRHGRVSGSAMWPHLLALVILPLPFVPPYLDGSGFLSCHLLFSFPGLHHLDTRFFALNFLSLKYLE